MQSPVFYYSLSLRSPAAISCQQVGKCLDGPARRLFCLFYGAEELAARGILVASTVEELFRHLVAREVVYRPQAHEYEVVALCVLAQGYRETVSLDTQWFVDKSLKVALLKVVVVHNLTLHTVIGRM